MYSHCTLRIVRILRNTKKCYSCVFILATVSTIVLFNYLTYMDFHFSNSYNLIIFKGNQSHVDFVANDSDHKNVEAIVNGTVVDPIVNFSDIFTGQKSGKYLVVQTSDPHLPISLPVISALIGGIGNQLFQFACSYAVAKKRNSDVYILMPNKNIFSPNHTHTPLGRLFALDHFNIWLLKYMSNETKTKYGVFKFQDKHIWEQSLPPGQTLELDDVCASEYYFKDYREDIKEMFKLNIDEGQIQDYLDIIKSSESVSIHVRQGDSNYKGPNNRSLPISYHKRAIKWMNKMVTNATFVVFTDDIKYARAELGAIKNIIFVDNTNKSLASLYDFLLMSRCKHNIIANSTFSWWAAYLNRNENKIIIAPMPRHPPGWNEAMYKDKDKYKYRNLVFNNYLYPVEWLTINPFNYI